MEQFPEDISEEDLEKKIGINLKASEYARDRLFGESKLTNVQKKALRDQLIDYGLVRDEYKEKLDMIKQKKDNIKQMYSKQDDFDQLGKTG